MTAHSDRAHAKLAPSAMQRIIYCPPSVQMSVGVEETRSSYAEEGTSAHELAEWCLSRGEDAAQYKGWTIHPGGLHAPEEGGAPDGKTCWRVDAEMVEAVQVHLNLARQLKAESDEFATEQRLDMSGIVPGVFGTGDIIAYREKPTRRVTVCDFKFGRGIAVEVEGNEQLLTYALGVAQRHHNRGVDEVELIIVQPRAPHRDGPVRRWVAPIEELYEHVMAMQTAAALVGDPNAPFRPGRKQCTFCKGAGRCKALRTKAMEITMNTDPTVAPFRDWAAEAEDIELVKIWARRREEFAHAEAIRGRIPPGAKLVAKRSNRTWKDEGEAVATLQMLGVDDDDIWSSKVNSPASIEKALPKADRKIVAALSFKPPGGTVLAPLSDPRPAADHNDASGFDDHGGEAE